MFNVMARARVEAEEVEMAGVVIVLIVNGNRMYWPSPRTVETLDCSLLLMRDPTGKVIRLKVPLQDQRGVSKVCNA